MKKVLSILLVIAMSVALFAGCGENPSQSPSDANSPAASITATPTSNEPTKDPKSSWSATFNKGDALVSVNVYDTTNYLAQWGVGTKVMMAKEGLKLGTIISPVLSDQISINNYSLLKTDSGRSSYVAAISNLFLSADTTPDIMPGLYATNTGTEAIFKGTIGKKYLVNLAPFLEEGAALDNYVSYVWGDNYGDASYWETVKEALMTEEGEIFAIPRLEYTPVKRLVFFNTEALEDMTRNQPTTLADLEDALAAWTAEGNPGFVFNPEWMTIESIITPIANMYGIDFDSSFDWKEMNGEPMFSYYYPEYLETLKTVNKWAANGWVTNAKDNAGHIAMCGDLATDGNVDSYGTAEDLAKHGLAMYGEAWHGYKLRDDRLWQSSTISAAGYTAAVTAESAVDYNYFAITKRSVTADTEEGYATVLKIMNYVNSTLNFEAYINATFGKEGVCFADTWEESGSYVWVEKDGKQYVRSLGGSDRYTMQYDNIEDPFWKQGKAFYRTLHPLYTWVLDVCNGFKSGDGVWRSAWGFDKMSMNDQEGLVQAEDGSFNFDEVCDLTWDEWSVPGMSKRDEVPSDMSEWGYYAALASKPESEGGYGITEFKYGTYTEGVTKMWTRDGYSGGITWFADVTAFPMQYTIYYMNESQSTMYPIREALEKTVDYNGTNTIIAPGFFPSASEVLSGSEASDMALKMESLKMLAKNFTIDFLSGKKGENDWVAYTKSLKDAGIEEVYEFYVHNAYSFTTKHKDGTKSMSDVLAANK